ncbi:hypothetical protein QBC34DRAFT_455802 [Podospora aff. communis PSN243]|uniref:F-box domain-containing protein n=1 Tax=Podospora aff. communis PSN243 TaxID=3040156 RepID=A0AAV9GYB9_9PEZI|nr:hypothetical protein QBC34DRAFT_455802 [Podospora aff. communis PSN243]
MEASEWYWAQVEIFRNGARHRAEPAQQVDYTAPSYPQLDCNNPRKRKLADEGQHEAINDWEHDQFPLLRFDRGQFPIKKRRSCYFRTYPQRTSTQHVVPFADAAEHSRILERSGYKPEELNDLLKPSRIHNLSASEHVNLLSYLDGLKNIPEVAGGSDALDDHIDNLKSLTYHANTNEAAPKFDFAAAQELSRTLSLLPSANSTRLSVRSKNIAFGLDAFVRRTGTVTRFEEDAMSMRNTESLEIRYTGNFDDLFLVRRFHHRLLRDGSQFSRLKRLRLLLRVPEEVNSLLYGAPGRLRDLQNLQVLKDLTIPMEGLFGPTRRLGKLFGGTRFIGVLDEAYTDENFFDTEPLEDIVQQLPRNLETLRIVDWYHEYSEPAGLLPSPVSGQDSERLVPHPGFEDDLDGVKRLSALQTAVMAALSKLGPVLAAHTKLKKVTFWVHKWNDPDKDNLWKDWSQALAAPGLAAADISMETEDAPLRTSTRKSAVKGKTSKKRKEPRPTTNLRKLKREYQELGITLRVAIEKGDQE